MDFEVQTPEIDRFLNGSLVTWLKSCSETFSNDKLSFQDLVDGVLMHTIFLQMEVQADDGGLCPSGNDPQLRERNLKQVLANLRRFYEEELGHLILRLPNVSRLAKEPHLNLRELELLLCLLLGCAVQCPNNKYFIDRIQLFDETTKAAIADYVAQVVKIPEIVLSPDMLIQEPGAIDLLASSVEGNVKKAFAYMRQIYKERNACVKRLSEVGDAEQILDCTIASEADEAVVKLEAELAELRSKVKYQRELIKEQTDDLYEGKEELEQVRANLASLQKENERLVSEARKTKIYMEEVEIANETAEKLRNLEEEHEKCRQKLTDLEFFKARIEELEEHERKSQQTKGTLIDALTESETNAERIIYYQNKIADLQNEIQFITQAKSESYKMYQKKCEENIELELLVRESNKGAMSKSNLDDSDSDEPEPHSSISMNCSLSDELNKSSYARALQLEIENRRLNKLVESIRRSSENQKRKLERKYSALLLEHEAVQEEVERQNERYRLMLQGYDTRLEHLKRTHLDVCKEKRKLEDKINEMQKGSSELERDLKEAREQLNTKSETLISMTDTLEEYRVKLQTIEIIETQKDDDDLGISMDHDKIGQKIANNVECPKNEKLRQEFELLIQNPLILTDDNDSSKDKSTLENIDSKQGAVGDIALQLMKMQIQCNSLYEAKKTLQNERNSLVNMMHKMMRRSNELTAQLFEERQQFHLKEKEYVDKINNQGRVKAKLEKKIFEHYQNLEPPKKRTPRIRGLYTVKQNISNLRHKSCEFFKIGGRILPSEDSLVNDNKRDLLIIEQTLPEESFSDALVSSSN